MSRPIHAPVMLVVAGPPGSGKSSAFPVAASGLDSFNIDDRAASLNGGSYRDIAAGVRAQAQQECREFIAQHIREGRSFAVETTLRDGAAIRQAREAKARGFLTRMVFISTGDAQENIRRIAARGQAGGHCAPSDFLRRGYEASMSNLPEALQTFDFIELQDNSERAADGHPAGPVRVVGVEGGHARVLRRPLPAWVRRALAAAGIASRP